MKESLNDPGRLAWEARCLERTRRGELAAFGELYRMYAGSLYSNILLPKLSNRVAAEDALAETFKSALERLDSFETHDTSIYFWLVRIASNKAQDMFRARKITGRKLIDAARMLEPLLPATPDPESLLGRAERLAGVAAHVARCLEAINPRYLRAIELRFFEERERQQCADELGVTLGTFDVLLLRALRAFRKAWDELVDGKLEQSHVA